MDRERGLHELTDGEIKAHIKKFIRRGGQVRDQEHLALILNHFPEPLRREVYDQVVAAVPESWLSRESVFPEPKPKPEPMP